MRLDEFCQLFTVERRYVVMWELQGNKGDGHVEVGDCDGKKTNIKEIEVHEMLDGFIKENRTVDAIFIIIQKIPRRDIEFH